MALGLVHFHSYYFQAELLLQLQLQVQTGPGVLGICRTERQGPASMISEIVSSVRWATLELEIREILRLSANVGGNLGTVGTQMFFEVKETIILVGT